MDEGRSGSAKLSRRRQVCGLAFSNRADDLFERAAVGIGHRESEFNDAIESETPDLERESVEEVLMRGQTVAELKAKIDELPESQRVVLTIWMSGEASYDEMARELGITVSSVKSLLFRAKQSLEKELRLGT